MKKTLFTSLMLLLSIIAFAQQPVITFTETEHNFGKIDEAGGKVSTVFEFKNEGMEPLVISNVRASCGCTTPKWTRMPVEPGQTGTITVTYNPSGRPGRFQKTVTITSNATTPTVKLYIKGEVIPKQVNPADKYPVKMGALSLAKDNMQFGIIMDDASKMQTIEYANLTDQPITVSIVGDSNDKCIVPHLSLETLAPKQTGKLSVKFDGKLCEEYGPITRDLYIMVNGKRVISDEYKITINATLRENFSKLTPEQRQQAPIIEAEQKIDLGTLKVGDKISKKIIIKNAGVNALILRKVICRNVAGLSLKPAKDTIKGGKSTTLNMTLNTASLNAGSYTRQIEIISNDPNRSRSFITLTWKVE